MSGPSGDALIAAAVELSEVSNELGEPMPGWEPQWHQLAARVAIEAAQELRHAGEMP